MAVIPAWAEETAAPIKTKGTDIPFLGIVQSGIDQDLREHAPKTVAVLPAESSEKVKAEIEKYKQVDPAALLRTVFFGRFSVMPYKHVHIRQVDKALAAVPDWKEKSPAEICPLLDAEAVVFMDVARAENMTAGIHSYTEYDATLRMVRGSDGKELWRAKLTYSDRGGVLSLKHSQLGRLVEFEQQNADRKKAFRLAAEEWSRRVVNDLRKKLKQGNEPEKTS